MGTVISKDGTPIAFDDYGAGPPVVLVGGAFQYRAFDPRTAELARLLSARFRVFHYDRRGRGGSGDTAPHAVQREVEDLQAIIAGAGGPASVFGMSSGAVLALEAAARGTPITRLALYEAPFIVDDSRPPFPPDYLAQLNKFLALGRRGGAVRFWLRMVGVPAPVVALMRCTPAWPKFKAVAHTLPYDAAIMAGTLGGVPLPAGRWTSVRVPALTVTGGKSPAWLHHGMQALTNILPRAENRILEGQTHMVKPEALAPVLEEFFSAGCGPAGETRHTQP
jgi:pimeloyl-ACP methyl ester carboxylesterase